jgi:proteic killer suppression protein
MLYLEDRPRGLPPDAVDKAPGHADVPAGHAGRPGKASCFPPLWRAHQLAGDRKGIWSLHVTRNWRLTFQIKDGQIWDVDYEDYH